MREKTVVRKILDTPEILSFIILNTESPSSELKIRTLEILASVLKDCQDNQNYEFSTINSLVPYLSVEKYRNSFINMTINSLCGDNSKFELLSNLFGVFRFDQKIRQESWTYLIDEKVIKWLFDSEKEFTSNFSKQKHQFSVLDPFKEFLGNECLYISYKSKIFPEKTNFKKKMVFDDTKGLMDLLDISRNISIEQTIRQSSLDQLIVYIIQHSGSSVLKKFIEQNFNQCLLDFLRFGNSKTFYEVFNKYCSARDELVDVHRNYLTRLAALVSAMFMAPVFNPAAKVEVVEYLLSDKIMNQFLKNVILLITNLDRETRYQGFFLANLILLGNTKVGHYLQKGTKICKGKISKNVGMKAVKSDESPLPFGVMNS